MCRAARWWQAEPPLQDGLDGGEGERLVSRGGDPAQRVVDLLVPHIGRIADDEMEAAPGKCVRKRGFPPKSLAFHQAVPAHQVATGGKHRFPFRVAGSVREPPAGYLKPVRLRFHAVQAVSNDL